MAEFRIDGIQQLTAVLNRLGARAPSAMGAGLFAEAQDILGNAEELAPVDRGNLRASGTVQGPEVSMSGAQVEVGFGGAASDYALVQHERTDFRHTVGQAKYLEQPAVEAANGFEGRLAAKTRPLLETR